MKTTLKIIGLSSKHMKCLGLFFLSLNSLATYGNGFPLVSRYAEKLIILGALGTPILLLMLTEHIRATEKKAKLLIQLYMASVGTGLFTALTNLWMGEIIGIYRQNNILFTFFYTSFFIISAEMILTGFKEKCQKKTIGGIIGLLCIVLLHFMIVNLRSVFVTDRLSADWFDCFFVSPLYVEGTSVLIILGFFLYFLRPKWLKLLVFAVIAIAARSNYLETIFLSTPITTFFDKPQHYIFLALPFMALYGGKYETERNLVYVFYYPIHRYFIAAMTLLMKIG